MSSTLRKFELNDTAQLDAFGRLRVSNPGDRLDCEFLYDKQDSYFDERTNNGTVTFNGNSRDLTLSLSAATASDYAEMRSYPVPYTPGDSQLIDITGVLDLANLGTGAAYIFTRTKTSGSVVETEYLQSAWDDLTSGVDWADSHIFSMDFQSLKVGRIRFGLVQNGVFVPVKEVHNDNIRNTGYWQMANGCAYWRLYNDATYTYMEVGYGNPNNAIGFRYRVTATASATMKAICCTVKSEGGVNLQNLEGLPRAIDMGVTTATVSTTLIPLLSIRPKSTFQTYENMMLALPKSVSVQTDNPIKLVVIHDATLSAASWSDVDTSDSMIEYDTSATGYTGGHVVFTDYVATAKNTANSASGILGKTVLWSRTNSVTGILTVAAVRTSGTDATVLAGINWEELR
jgi:hypothetical protein